MQNPSNFPNCPKYFSKEANYRQSRDENLKPFEEQQFLTVIENSKTYYTV